MFEKLTWCLCSCQSSKVCSSVSLSRHVDPLLAISSYEFSDLLLILRIQVVKLAYYFDYVRSYFWLKK